MNSQNQLGEAPVKSLFFKYYIPALTSILSVTFHQVVNGIILGQQVGKEGLAAVGLYGPVVIVFIALTLPVMVGGGILIGKSIGAGNYQNAQQIFQFATTLALLFGGIIAFSSPLLIKPIADFLAGNEHSKIVDYLSDYMFWQLISLPFFFLRMFWGNFISNDSGPKVSRNASLIGVALNVILDVLLVMGLHLGVEGASIATAVSIFVSASYLFFYIRKGKNNFSFRNFQFTLKCEEWKVLVHFGLPSFASELSFSSGLLMISHSVVPYGPLAVAAFGLVNYLSFIFIRLFTAAMIASLPIISFNIGAKLPVRVLDIFKFAFSFTLVLGFIVTAVGFIVPDLLVGLVSENETDEFANVAGNATKLYFILFIGAGPNYILSAYLQSIGKSGPATSINILKGFLLIAVFMFLLTEYFKMGLNGILLSRSFAEIFTLVLVIGYTLYRKEDFFAEDAIIAKT
ncbi:MATE family efflux transporter [Dyadobacter sp. LHD-138]|uniref:MATE family efflux transporter n=1 Tax=Dyadobacter sp. LHD-138 TaxID=3071413 RepID=UPI0027E174A2|nr:MATE family efflux transporter [Dyadobacter sp. LHD-138]MDQ6478104.1 MATE family efflux transporter [Dyadobacter sp. LHD-138]